MSGTKNSSVAEVSLLCMAIIPVGFMLLFVNICWEGFKTESKIKDAQEQALEHTIALNECKLTGYYMRSRERMFVCNDGHTYREDSNNLVLVRVQ